jgi:phytoene dehydrogenase-like protein
LWGNKTVDYPCVIVLEEAAYRTCCSAAVEAEERGMCGDDLDTRICPVPKPGAMAAHPVVGFRAALLLTLVLVEAFSAGRLPRKHRLLRKFEVAPKFSSYLAASASIAVEETSPPDVVKITGGPSTPSSKEKATVCVIGGGVSGLTAAISVAEAGGAKVVLLEASQKVGGRVQSEVTDDGYVLDHGFAVFVEEYPFAKKLLDYDDLRLKRFLPGALIKIGDDAKFARVSDPLREPGDLLTTLFSKVGSIADKLKLIPFIVHARITSIEKLFEEPETDTLTALTQRWRFSDEIIQKFFSPFLQGIYLAPLQEQSSRMLYFVIKMFSEGSVALPQGGMAAVAKQLERKAVRCGVDIRVGDAVSGITMKDPGGYVVQSADGRPAIEAQSIIVATDSRIAQKLVSQIKGFEFLANNPEATQRCVGCLYYTFDGSAPVIDPILILNGDHRKPNRPINNACFPSTVSLDYAPEGSSLCSVTILSDAVETYRGKESELDLDVRAQLATWFPEYESEIKNKWQLKKIFYVRNAQPVQFGTPFPASANGGRNCDEFQGKKLPGGLFICGDHMATSSLNGAFESGVNAGIAAASLVLEQQLR